MSANTKIEWAHHSWSPWWGCVEVSPACDHCYARELAERYGHHVWGKDAPRRELSEAHWKKPVRWNAEAASLGIRYRVFPSMCDPFEFGVAKLDRVRADFWELIEDTQSLDWLLLTKRPGNARRMFPAEWLNDFPQHVWVGATVEDRAHLWRVAELLKAPAGLRFLSIEPLLEDLGKVELENEIHGIDWVIVGTESGPRARPTNLDWIRRLRDQCSESRVPFFCKQITERGIQLPFEQWPEDLRVREFPA